MSVWVVQGPFGLHAGSVRDLFGVRSGSVRSPFEVHTGCLRDPFGVRSGSVLDPFEVRSPFLGLKFTGRGHAAKDYPYEAAVSNQGI